MQKKPNYRKIAATFKFTCIRAINRWSIGERRKEENKIRLMEEINAET